MTRNLSRNEIIDEVTEIGEELLEKEGFELVEVDYLKEDGDFVLRVYIYKEDGITIEDCQSVSRALSDKIDEADPIPGAYLLEVSSPGLDRPISTDKDLKRNLNKDIEVRLYQAIDKIKNFEGNLIDFNDDEVTIVENNGEERKIPRELISLMRLVIKF